jgi:endonuclease/exonuclease/phosphatase family metal-dependent hydrolase
MPQLRVATYNISGGITEDKRFYSKRGNPECGMRIKKARATMDGIAKLLQSEEIQIAAIQEADTCYCGEHTLDQGQYLADQLSAQVESQPLFEYHLGRHTNVRTGLATLSIPEIRQGRPVRFSQKHVSWERKLKANVVNAHLTHDIDAQKEHELSYLLDYCLALDPVVLLGDLNTSPLPTRSAEMVEGHYFGADKCMAILAEYKRANADRMHVDTRLGGFLDDAPEVSEVCTYPSGAESIKLDYCIGFSSRPEFTLSAEKVISSGLSNHSPSSVLVSW